jgi:hypothetical protein
MPKHEMDPDYDHFDEPMNMRGFYEYYNSKKLSDPGFELSWEQMWDGAADRKTQWVNVMTELEKEVWRKQEAISKRTYIKWLMEKAGGTGSEEEWGGGGVPNT